MWFTFVVDNFDVAGVLKILPTSVLHDGTDNTNQDITYFYQNNLHRNKW